MPSKQTVENIMVPLHHFPLVREDDVVAEAIRVMRHFFHRQDGTWYGFQAALVLNQKDQLVGLLTLRGLLRAFQLQAIQDHLLKGDATGLFFMGKFNDSLEIVVRDIMRPINLITVQKGSSVFEVIRKMHKWKISLLPVMDGGELVGMVRTIDVFWIVGELLD
ncbi:CBS domain-containing protein [Desulfoscipio geothermicus]|uniref:CBS domain-containing protein n=1 Tax=Desulfoscipio geothermicus DSM 3669 TaxID=1121426 RepID=A0A1I6DR20_9FIRM|nr:CBS domain-containing protein [Desulfoscipio geothermicus]SFR07920.1 CBS domain-containing protein [Desulfoscipio geothermicus DSM 3669]